MIEEYGVKLDNFTYDKLQCFFDDFIDDLDKIFISKSKHAEDMH